MKRGIVIISILTLITIFLNGAVLTRDNVINTAAQYASYSWIVERVNPVYSLYSVAGQTVVGEAYSYGDKDDTLKFQTDIDNGLIPRNWKSETDDNPANPSSGYTGIDCSGLVWCCWGANGATLGWPHTSPYVLEIEDTLVKAGDTYHGEKHYQIYMNNKAIYEAAGYSNTEDVRQRVILSSITALVSNPIPYSIFPQFSECTPEQDSTITENDIEIGVTVL